MRSRVLVTGATGYLGTACVDRLARARDTEILAVWHTATDRVPRQPLANVRYVRCDLTKAANVEALFDGADIRKVVHAAALLPDGKPRYESRAVEANAQATENVVASSVAAGATRIVYCSSISVYGDLRCPEGGWSERETPQPSSAYARTKYAGEESVSRGCAPDGLAGVNLRFAGIHGPGRCSGAVYHMMRSAVERRDIVVNNPSLPFQLLFLDDAANAVARALEVPLDHSCVTINVASHTFPSLSEMAEAIAAICGSNSILRSGETTATEPQIMSTRSMGTTLGMSPTEPRSHLMQTLRWLEQSELTHG